MSKGGSIPVSVKGYAIERYPESLRQDFLKKQVDP
jgi:hypothetical protein